MNLTIMIGAGGTGSYVLPMLIERYESQSQDNLIAVIDGDILEERNLNRQAFYLSDIGLNKAEALVGHYRDADLKTQIVQTNGFITSLHHLIKYVKVLTSVHTDINTITLLCCADNNMVRYRMELAVHYLLNIPTITSVEYVDSGNSELSGQVLYTRYRQGDTEFQDDGTIKIYRGESDSIFARMPEEIFEDKLTFADFELSCDIVSESAPQNIATNQLAAYYMIEALDTCKSYSFNSFTSFGKELPKLPLERVQEELNKMVTTTVYETELQDNQEQIQIKWR